MPEREILNLIKTRRRPGLEYMYELYGPAIYGIIKRLATTDEVAEQLLVQVFLQAWQEGARVDVTQTNILSWLINITVRTLQEQLRRGTIDRSALQSFPELSEDPKLSKHTAKLLHRLQQEIRNSPKKQPYTSTDSTDEKLQHSVLALRARMKINEALQTK